VSTLVTLLYNSPMTQRQHSRRFAPTAQARVNGYASRTLKHPSTCQAPQTVAVNAAASRLIRMPSSFDAELWLGCEGVGPHGPQHPSTHVKCRTLLRYIQQQAEFSQGPTLVLRSCIYKLQLGRKKLIPPGGFSIYNVP